MKLITLTPIGEASPEAKEKIKKLVANRDAKLKSIVDNFKK